MIARVSAFLVPFVAAGFLATAADARLPQGSRSFSLDDSLYRLIGSAKEAVGDTLFLKADTYYHGGTDLEFEEKDYGKEGLIEAAAAGNTGDDWVARLYGRVRSHEHYHLSGEEKRELLPLFALATTLDPKNVEALLTTAYWLESNFGKLDEAVRVLEKGVRDNPQSWEIEMRLGLLLYKKKDDPAAAAPHLLAALEKARGKELERYEWLDTHYFLAESLRRLGRPEEAAAYYLGASSYAEPGSDLKAEINARVREQRKVEMAESEKTVLL